MDRTVGNNEALVKIFIN